MSSYGTRLLQANIVARSRGTQAFSGSHCRCAVRSGARLSLRHIGTRHRRGIDAGLPTRHTRAAMLNTVQRVASLTWSAPCLYILLRLCPPSPFIQPRTQSLHAVPAFILVSTSTHSHTPPEQPCCSILWSFRASLPSRCCFSSPPVPPQPKTQVSSADAPSPERSSSQWHWHPRQQ